MAQASIYDILDVLWLKDNFLFGVDFRDYSGNPFPDGMFDDALKSAVSSVEQDLDITVEPVQTMGERHEHNVSYTYSKWSMRLRRRPFIGFDRIELKYGNMDLATLPNSWGTCLDYKQSDVHIIPQTDELGQVHPIIVPSMAIYAQGDIPGWFAMDYRSGCRVYSGQTTITAGDAAADVAFDPAEKFIASNYAVVLELVDPNPADASILPRESAKQVAGMHIGLSRATTHDLVVKWYVTDIPDNLRRLIGVRAAKGPLAIAGDMILGPGVQSRTLNMDGLSQGTVTSKRGRGAYGDRIANLEVEEAALRNELQKQLGTFNMSMI